MRLTKADRETERARWTRYNATPKGRERKRRYRLTAKGLEAKRRYRHSPKGINTAMEYNQTPARLAASALRRELQSPGSRERENRLRRDANRERVFEAAGRSERDHVRAVRLRTRMLNDID
jgi:DNA-binding PadR family transcriptional regulator